ncbi:gephyrin-like isoform X2 [Camponotus floridanus]|uniref:gephyrin-like isoform X2 n=1 Tax=Camponotus floridanus TaxID=104421 RepID=UPI000DC66406|nr:gephyrin-like isoform X2 [Camponotus floridanus]
MSSETETSFTFIIVAVGIKKKLENYVDLMKNMILETEKTMKKHIRIYYIRCVLNEIQLIIEFIKINNIYKYLILRAVCGIQNNNTNNTLIFNIFGKCMDAIIFWSTNKEKLFDLFKIVQDFASTNYRPSVCNTPNNFSLEKIKNIKEYKKTPVVTVSEAIKIIGDIVSRNSPINFEYVNVLNAYDRILSEDVKSRCNIPSFRTSAKHGYAIIVNDGKNKKKILEAGSTFSLKPGTCVKVQSGASIPDEATAVVKIKNIKTISKNDDDDDYNIDIEKNEEKIEIVIEPKEGENIRPIGHEIKIGEKILNKHTRIGPAEMGLLTYFRIYYVQVIKYPSIGILSIGDELQELGEILRAKHNYDSNKLILTILLKQEGFNNVLDFGIANDNIISIHNKIKENLKKVNVVVTIGSANDRDLLKPILQEYFNATIHFGNIDMKPGKSTTYATCMFESTRKHFLCLSKNSAVIPIATHLFLLPLVNELCCFNKERFSVLARIRLAPDLHPRPKYIWTALKWKKDTYPWILNMANHYINNSTNALLRLPPRTVDMSKLLPDALIATMLIGSK